MTAWSDYSGVVQAGCAVVGVLGGGIGLLWRRVESNNSRIKTEISEMQTALKECELREDNARDQRGVLTTVIELLWQIAPSGSAKQRARRLLDSIHAGAMPFSEGNDQ